MVLQGFSGIPKIRSCTTAKYLFSFRVIAVSSSTVKNLAIKQMKVVKNSLIFIILWRLCSAFALKSGFFVFSCVIEHHRMSVKSLLQSESAIIITETYLWKVPANLWKSLEQRKSALQYLCEIADSEVCMHCTALIQTESWIIIAEKFCRISDHGW